MRPPNILVVLSDEHTAAAAGWAGLHGIWQKQCFYEPAVRVPLLLRQSSVQPDRNDDQVSLVDVLPTLRHIAGLRPGQALPGRTLLDPVGVVGVSRTGDGRRRLHAQVRSVEYCYYGTTQRPQIFNVDTDRLELHDLSTDEALVAKLDSEFRSRWWTPIGSTYSRNPTRPSAWPP